MTAKEFFKQNLSGEPLTEESIIEALDDYYLLKKELTKNYENEVWLDIPNFENLYQVSNFGRVKSLNRLIENKNGTLQKYKGGILTLRNLNGGYKQVTLSNNNKRNHFLVHKLVMLAFKGESEFSIDHIDRNPSNNKLENLRYLTHQKNCFNKSSKGYWWNKINNKWQAKIMLNGKAIHLGLFDNEQDASIAYREAKEKYHII